MLKAGDAIDIYVSRTIRGREATVPVLQGMRVLTATDTGDGGGHGQITLAARPDEAMRYLSARQAGTLTAVLRNRDDPGDIDAGPAHDPLPPVGPALTPQRSSGVVILYGDRPDERAQTLAPTSALADFESEHP